MQQKPLNNIAKTITTYVVWLIVSVSIVGLALLLHEALIALVFLTQINPWGLRAIDLWSMVILGLIALIAIFFTEGYFREGTRKGDFWKRVGMTLLIEGVVAAVGLIVRALV